MSHYPEADEAQRRHYNDGYTPNPYDNYVSDPFNPPAQYPPQQQQPYRVAFSPPPHNPYASPPPPPPPPIIRPSSVFQPPPPPPPPHPLLASSSSFSASAIHPGPSATPASMYHPYDHEEHEDTGESPLLRRHASEMSFVHVPRKFDDEDAPVVDDARSENNVRYGRIPQRVPRRYKTLKKVEYDPFYIFF